MTSREFLTQLKRLHDLMKEEEADLEDEREEIASDLPANGKEGYLKRVEILERVHEKHKAFYPVLRNRIGRTILTLTNKREQQVLILRYLDLLEWDEIAYRMDGTTDAVWGVHKRALKHLIV